MTNAEKKAAAAAKKAAAAAKKPAAAAPVQLPVAPEVLPVAVDIAGAEESAAVEFAPLPDIEIAGTGPHVAEPVVPVVPVAPVEIVEIVEIVGDEEDELIDLLRRPAFREWLTVHTAAANKVLRVGPAGSGWQYNATKRQDAEDLAAALNGLTAAIQLAV